MIILLLVSSVCFGIITGHFCAFSLPSELSTVLLVMLVFVVGIDIGSGERIFVKLRLSFPKILWQSIYTIAGTFFGALICSWVLPLSALETMTAASGLGWYSLSGTMISQMHSPLLGAVSFASNVFREVLAILLVPVFGKKSPNGAISLGGATTMDTLLGLISRYTNPEDTLVAFGQGVILSLTVPLWISFFLHFLIK
jgi:uncharacterized membrane protein YbjE (DUF340 family)